MAFWLKSAKSHTYKCLLVGNSGCGKSCFVRRLATGAFEQKHVPTQGVIVHTLPLQTNYQSLALEIWDCAGDERYAGLGNGYYFYARCAIVMFDLSQPSTGDCVCRLLQQIYNICGEQTPVVLCGNKAELQRPGAQLCYRKRDNLDYCELSVQAAWNLQAPLELLSRRLLRQPQLRLISEPQLEPADNSKLSASQVKQWQARMQAVHKRALPAKKQDTQPETTEQLQRLDNFLMLN